MHRIRSHLTYANVMVTILAFFVLGGGTALAAYVVSSNAQIGPGTISGHKPPTGKHANVIAGSLNATDLAAGAVGPAKLATGAVTSAKIANRAVTAPKLAPPEPVHLVGAPGEPPFTSGSNETGLPNAGFYMDGTGRVHLQGTVNVGTGETLFALPARYVPVGQTCFSVPAFTPAIAYTTDRICLIPGSAGGKPNADVRNSDGGGTRFIDLSGISFRAVP